jgi:hypothetical protein
MVFVFRHKRHEFIRVSGCLNTKAIPEVLFFLLWASPKWDHEELHDE